MKQDPQPVRIKTVSVDWDGVIHLYESGWQGPCVIPDPPVPGALDWLRVLVDHPALQPVIYSSRSKYEGAIEAMQQWLLKHGLEPHYVEALEFATDKPPAHLTLDDRGVLFTGAFPTPEEILRFHPWNKPQDKDLPVCRPSVETDLSHAILDDLENLAVCHPVEGEHPSTTRQRAIGMLRRAERTLLGFAHEDIGEALVCIDSIKRIANNLEQFDRIYRMNIITHITRVAYEAAHCPADMRTPWENLSAQDIDYLRSKVEFLLTNPGNSLKDYFFSTTPGGEYSPTPEHQRADEVFQAVVQAMRFPR